MIYKPQQSIDRIAFYSKAAEIPDTAEQRINEPLRSVLFNNPALLHPNQSFFDVHAHSFTIEHVPRNFIKLLGWVSEKDKLNLLRWWNKRFAALIGLNDPAKVLKSLILVYDQFFAENQVKPHLFLVNLCMDMERGISGPPVLNYRQQIEQLLLMVDTEVFDTNYQVYSFKASILPFLAIDANNPDAYQYFLSAFIKDYNPLGIQGLTGSAPFYGIKLYPSLGFHPEDPVILDIMKVCAEKSIPVTTHCGGIRTRASSRKIQVGRRKIQNGRVTDTTQWVNVRSKEHFKHIFLDPLHWRKVLDEFPKLKLNLAHFGDNEEWLKYHRDKTDATVFINKVLRLMEDYNHVYADISYSYFEEDNRKAMFDIMQHQKFKNRILNGSDFFLTEIEKQSTRDFIRGLYRDFIRSQEAWHRLTVVNPYHFIFSPSI